METRILSKGQIKDLSTGFSLGGTPFSIYVRSKELSMENDTLVRCRLICDSEQSEMPVPVGDWTPAKISYIAPNGIDLTKYDVYWGAGSTPNV